MYVIALYNQWIYTIVLTFDEIFTSIYKNKIRIYFIWFASCEIGCNRL